MIRCSLPTASIDAIGQYAAGIKVYFHHLGSHIRQEHFNVLRSVLCIKKSAVGQVIILRQECDDSKKKFGDCYLEYKVQPSYEQNFQRCIMEYEGVDDDEDIAHYFEDLSIDKYNDYSPEPESFYTKLEQFHTFFD